MLLLKLKTCGLDNTRAAVRFVATALDGVNHAVTIKRTMRRLVVDKLSLGLRV